MRINAKFLLALATSTFLTFTTQYFVGLPANVAIWGINSDNDCFELIGTAWQKRGTQKMRSISVGYGGNVLGVTQTGQFCEWSQSKNDWVTKTPTPKLYDISISWDDIWAIGSNYSIYILKNGTWQKQQGLLRQVSVGGKQGNPVVMGTNKNNQAFEWTGDGWRQIGTIPILYISVSDLGNAFAVGTDNKVYNFNNDKWSVIDSPPLVKVENSHGEVWALDSSNKIWRWLHNGTMKPTNPSRVQNGWEQTDGLLRHIAIGGMSGAKMMPSHTMGKPQLIGGMAGISPQAKKEMREKLRIEERKLQEKLKDIRRKIRSIK